MLYKIVVVIAFASLSMTAKGQMKVIINGIERYSIDTMPRANLSPIKSFDSKQLDALLREETNQTSATFRVDNMPCLKPDMRNFSTFSLSDPTKKADYIADDMPNAFQKRIKISLTPDAKK